MRESGAPHALPGTMSNHLFCSEENPWNAIPEFDRDTLAALVSFAAMKLASGMCYVYCESLRIKTARGEGARERTRGISVENDAHPGHPESS